MFLKLWISLLFWGYFWCESAPIPKRMIDLTHLFNNDTLHYPTVKNFEIKVLINGTIDDKYWLQLEEYSSSIHVGTHMDSPCHFARGRWSVDQIPLNHLIAPVAVLNIEEKAEANRDYQVTINDLTEWEQETEQTLNDTILLIRSGWGKRWGDRENFTGTASLDPTQMHFPSMSAEAAEWLVENRNIYGLGTETLSPDLDPSSGYRVHTTLLSQNIYILENVANVDKLPPYGATLYAMPMKIENASGAPTRIIATFPDDNFARDE